MLTAWTERTGGWIEGIEEAEKQLRRRRHNDKCNAVRNSDA